MTTSWQFWAILSAISPAATAISATAGMVVLNAVVADLAR